MIWECQSCTTSITKHGPTKYSLASDEYQKRNGCPAKQPFRKRISGPSFTVQCQVYLAWLKFSRRSSHHFMPGWCWFINLTCWLPPWWCRSLVGVVAALPRVDLPTKSLGNQSEQQVLSDFSLTVISPRRAKWHYSQTEHFFFLKSAVEIVTPRVIWCWFQNLIGIGWESHGTNEQQGSGTSHPIA